MGQVQVEALICERWPMQIDMSQADDWYAGRVRRQHNARSKSAACSYHAFLELQQHVHPGTVSEYFGGIGTQSLIIEGLFKPVSHWIVERDAPACAHLKRLLPAAHVINHDAYTIKLPCRELVTLDFGDFTIVSAQRKHQTLLDEVFSDQPQAVMITDGAGPRLALHRERYSAELNTDVRTYADYLRGLQDWVAQRYGYGTVACYWHRLAAKLALMPGANRAEPLLVPERPVGLAAHW